MFLTVIIPICAIGGLALSLYIAIYNWARNHLKKIDFWAEITYTNKEGDGADRPDETGKIKKGSRIEMHIVNKGCPITILGIYFDQTPKKTFKMHIDSLLYNVNYLCRSATIIFAAFWSCRPMFRRFSLRSTP